MCVYVYSHILSVYWYLEEFPEEEGFRLEERSALARLWAALGMPSLAVLDLQCPSLRTVC